MTIIANDDDFIVIDGKKVLKDGRKITVKMTTMDSMTVIDGAAHRPGQRATTDAKVAAAFEAYCRDISDAWRHGAAAPAASAPASDARAAAYSAMVDGLRDAWRAA